MWYKKSFERRNSRTLLDTVLQTFQFSSCSKLYYYWISLLIAQSKVIQDSLGFVDSTLWTLDSLSLELEFRIPITSGIPESLSSIPDSKAQDS